MRPTVADRHSPRRAFYFTASAGTNCTALPKEIAARIPRSLSLSLRGGGGGGGRRARARARSAGARPRTSINLRRDWPARFRWNYYPRRDAIAIAIAASPGVPSDSHLLSARRGRAAERRSGGGEGAGKARKSKRKREKEVVALGQLNSTLRGLRGYL